MQAYARFRGGRAREEPELPGGNPTSRPAPRGARARSSGGYVSLGVVVLFLVVVMVVTYVWSDEKGIDNNTDRVSAGVGERIHDRGVDPAAEAAKATAEWTTSPPAFEDLPKEQQEAVLQELSRLTLSQRPSTTTETASTTSTTSTGTVTSTPSTEAPHASSKLNPGLNEGERELQDPERLPGLTLHHRTYTPDELLAMHGDFTLVYSFVNGSEPNHFYRKSMFKACIKHITGKEAEWYQNVDKYYRKTGAAGNGHGGDEQDGDGGSGDELREAWVADQCLPSFLKDAKRDTIGDVWQAAHKAAVGGIDNRDRETDELRHSLRSVEQHIRWHRGRVVMVSPGHHPLWMDNAKNFLAGSCGGPVAAAQRESIGTHTRMTTVHQDALLPYGIKLTVNSHVIEQHLWRVTNISAVHVYYNDDYFVNRDIKITDLLNEYGGTIVRTERGVLGSGELGDNTASWAKGVRHTNLFTILELDDAPEDYLPPSLIAMWRTVRDIDATNVSPSGVPVPALSEVVDTGYRHHAEPMQNVKRDNVKRRRYATHAPFVYCTNMFSFIETRYEREFAFNTLDHRGRSANDLFIPFVYNAFTMSRPWQASPKFLPYLLQLKASRAGVEGVAPPTADIQLDSIDGCGPASLRSGQPSSDCVFGKFTDDEKFNKGVMASIATMNPLYFNINAGFKSAAVAQELRNFLSTKFPTPIYLERGVPAVSAEDAALPGLFAALMALPVVAVTSFAEGVCPLVRSLQLALPEHGGAVVPVVARHGGGADVDVTLAELRADMRHRVRNAMPVVGCAYNWRVRGLRGAVPVPASAAAAAGGEALVRVVEAALAELAANGTAAGGAAAVELPAVCGVGGVGSGGGGVRVRAMVVDGRAAQLPVRDARALRHAVTMPGQTLALEDFDVVRVAGGDAVLVLSRHAAQAKAVHWIDGAAEGDLLVTYPIPYKAYEDLDAPLVWSGVEP